MIFQTEPDTFDNPGKQEPKEMRHAALRVAALALMLMLSCPVNAATTLLPNGKQCFSNASGPLTTGSVYMYQPGTLIFKQTWQDAGQTILNSQPILLDSNGCAIIYGVGSYRQIVYEGINNTTPLVWDQVTTDTSAFNSLFWAALSGGTPNVITVTYPGFNATDGTVIQFVALNSNTGPTTINPSGFGAISVVKDTTAGPVALDGGEITAGNVISVVYYSADNRFHLLNTVIASASGSTAPMCGASQLVITNNVGTPNTIIDITAGQAITANASSLIQKRSNVSVSVNISLGTVTSTAGGMDGESPGTSRWLALWLIDNGSSIAGLASVSFSSPTLPSGYTYKCYIGAMQIDGAGVLYRTKQQGKRGFYKITPGTNTANNKSAPMQIAAGTVGTANLTSPTLVATQVAGDTFCAPPQATAVLLWTGCGFNGVGTCSVEIAPSAAYSGSQNGPNGSNGLVYPIYMNTTNTNIATTLDLESNSIYLATSGGGSVVACRGWIDNANVN